MIPKLTHKIDRLKTLSFNLPFYHHSLKTPEHTSIIYTPHDPWPGDAMIGNLLLQDIFHFEGHHQNLKTPNWWPHKAPQTWLNYAHSFHWLRDLRETSGETARRKARTLLVNWIEHNQKYDAFIWSADRIAKRIYALISLYDFYAATADDVFIDQITSFILKQIIHLKRTPLKQYHGNRLITILRGMLYGLFNLPHFKKETPFYEDLLLKTIPTLLNSESCHRSRNPTHHIELMRLLLDIKNLYQTARQPTPMLINQTLKMMAPLAKFFIGNDQKLSLFHGSWEQDLKFLALFQTYLDPKLKPFKSYPLSGYEKIIAGKTSLIMDTAPPPEPPFDRWAHASSLAFELISGKQKIITNCGHPQDNHEEWDRLLSSTAAHSTLIIEGMNSSQILEKGIGKKPSIITTNRQEIDTETRLEAQHNGYENTHHLIHHRHLTLSKNGYIFKGEDILEGAADKSFVIRFHLHPKVKASLIQDGKAVLLHPLTGPGWRMDVTNAEISIDQSVYYGNGKSIMPTQQICLSGKTRASTHYKTHINWQFKTVPR